MISDTDKKHVTGSLERLSCQPIELMERFYDNLFQMAPEVEKLFRGDMQKQYEKLLEMVMLVTHSLDNLTSLVVAVEELGQRHLKYGAKEAHYDAVGQSLIKALSDSVTDWSDEDQAAWVTLYGYLSDLMITGAQDFERSRESA